MKKECGTFIDLSNMALQEPTQQEIEEFRKKALFSIEKDNETGIVTISPMNEEKNIVLHGEERVKWFIEQLKDTIQQ